MNLSRLCDLPSQCFRVKSCREHFRHSEGHPGIPAGSETQIFAEVSLKTLYVRSTQVFTGGLHRSYIRQAQRETL